MRTALHITQFLLAGLVVVIVGATLGWYVFIHRQIQTTTAQDTARGAGIAPSFGSPQGSTFANTAAGDNTSAQPQNGTSSAPRLWQISKTPVAGFGFDATSTGLILFVERASGNVLQADPSRATIERLTNTLFPKTYDAAIIGEYAILRSIDGNALTTYAGAIAASTSTGEVGTLDGVYLPKNILTIAARDKSTLAYLLQNPHGGSLGVTSDLAGKGQKQFFSSALADWRLIGLKDGVLYLVQKPADGVPGFSFMLQKDGSLSPLISNVPGLMIAPRASSTALLWSSSGGSSLVLFGRTAANASAETLPIKTVAEKCAWGPGSSLIAYCAVPRTLSTSAFLNDWYAGALHTTDAIWKVDVSAGTAEQFFATDSTLALDMENLRFDPSGSYLVFINATDKTLWSLRIAQ